MNNSQKRVMIVRNAYKWQFGGAEKFTYNSALSLTENGLGVIVVSNVPELLNLCKKSSIKTNKNIWLKNETRRRFALLYYLMFPLLVLQYVYIMKKNKIDLVMASGRDEELFATQAAKILHKPVLWVDHADMKGIVSQPFPFLKSLYFNSMQYASKIVAVSMYEKNMILKGLDNYKNKFVVINNGAIRLKGKKIIKPNNSIVLGYLGRLEKDKGIRELIYVFDKLVNSYDNVFGWIAGNGTLKKEVEVFANKNNKIKYLGYLKNVYDMLESIDIFVYPTYHDASPLAPVEALLAGVPVVASRVGGIPEVLNKKCSILVMPKNKDQLLETLENLIKDKAKLNKLSREAREEGKRYDFSQVFKEEYMPLINSLL